jgi:aldehyde:ferredoxin oxidoreductase
MTTQLPGYHGIILEVDLSSRSIQKTAMDPKDYQRFIGGRGLGMKLLWDRIQKAGLDPCSGDNPLIFMPGPFSGLPVPSSSRTCVVTKSPHTSPVKSRHQHASTVTYSNFGGFFGPEIRFAGYDGILIAGQSSKPVYLHIDDDQVAIKDATQYWGMGTDEFDQIFLKDLGDRRYRTCYIGPAGELQVPYASIHSTVSRAAGRGGAGCIMGSKKLKAIAVRGSGQPTVFDLQAFHQLLNETRKQMNASADTAWWRSGGTTTVLGMSSANNTMAVKNYREGTFADIDKIGTEAARNRVWARSYACFLCPLACKNAGMVKVGLHTTLSHDGPEYETGTMFGANLMISDLGGLLKCIYTADDLGIDIISCGNVIGFLMEAYEKKLIDKALLDGIDLAWGNVDAVLHMIVKIARRDGIGELASKGVKALSQAIGQGSESFAIHVKGQELAAWNIHVDPEMAVGYSTANRGACHINTGKIAMQHTRAMFDSLGICWFAVQSLGGNATLVRFLNVITGSRFSEEEFLQTGERIYTLEKMFNCREGFNRSDDQLPDRFFTEALTLGDKKGAVLDRNEFKVMMDHYYQERDWDIETTQPSEACLRRLGLPK